MILPKGCEGWKIKCENPGDYEVIKELITRDGFIWGQKDSGKPLHVRTVWNEKSIRAILGDASVPYKLKPEEKAFPEKECKATYNSFLQEEEMER